MQHRDGTSDEALMSQYQEHLDATAFDQLVTRYFPSALAVARQIISDGALAEDAVQETFLHILRQRKRYLPSLPFSRWFYTILRNVCRDMLRRRSRQAELLKKAAVRQPSPERRTSSDTLEHLATLPAEMRRVLVLRVVHSLSFRDIAAALGITEEAAKKRAQRALRRLRRKTVPL
jgi:RNA polymerase sigma-70 factor (ECF subfamily)